MRACVLRVRVVRTCRRANRLGIAATDATQFRPFRGRSVDQHSGNRGAAGHGARHAVSPGSRPRIRDRRCAAGARERNAGPCRIQVTYQEFFAPGQVMRAELPGYTLTFSAKDMRFSAAVPGFGFVASPFRDDLQPTLDPAQMRPDHAALQAEAPGAVRLMLGGLVLIVIGLALFIRAFPLASRRQPFAAVAARFARASRRANTSASETERDILLAMHRAFDASAGKPVLAEDVDDFLSCHQHFLPLRTRIAWFFACSRDVFFTDSADTLDIARLGALCRDLARAERLA